MVRDAPLDAFEALLRLFVWNVSVGGSALRVVFVAAAVAAVTLAGLGVVHTWRKGLHGRALLVAALGFVVPLGAGVAAAAWGRMGFNWNYVLPSLPPMVVAFAWGTQVAPTARRAGGTAVAAGALLSLLNSLAPASEDHRASVRWVFEHFRERDVLYVAELQGQVFEQGLAWNYYAPRLARELPPPHPVPRRATRWFDVEAPEELDGHERVLVQGKLLDEMALTARLRERYPDETLETFGWGVEVRVFRPAAAD